MSDIRSAIETLLNAFLPAQSTSPAPPVATARQQSYAPAAPSVRERVAAAPATFSVSATDGTVITFEALPNRQGARVTIPGVGSKDLGVGAILGLRDALVTASRV